MGGTIGQATEIHFLIETVVSIWSKDTRNEKGGTAVWLLKDNSNGRV